MAISVESGADEIQEQQEALGPAPTPNIPF